MKFVYEDMLTRAKDLRSKGYSGGDITDIFHELGCHDERLISDVCWDSFEMKELDKSNISTDGAMALISAIWEDWAHDIRKYKLKLLVEEHKDAPNVYKINDCKNELNRLHSSAVANRTDYGIDLVECEADLLEALEKEYKEKIIEGNGEWVVSTKISKIIKAERKPKAPTKQSMLDKFSKEEILELCRQNLPRTEIRRILKISHETLNSIMRYYGIEYSANYHTGVPIINVKEM